MAESSVMSNCCDVCGAKVGELRRGRCWGCYSKWADGRAVGMGAACCMCNDRRREHLRSVELLSAWVPICHNCCARAMTLTRRVTGDDGSCRGAVRRRTQARETVKPDSGTRRAIP